MNLTEARQLVVDALRHVAPEIDVEGLDDGAPLQDAAELDSLDFLNLVAAMSARSGLEKPERDYPSLATLGGCVTYVARHA